jgi:hypothetical protein
MTIQYQYRVHEEGGKNSEVRGAYDIIDGQCIVLASGSPSAVQDVVNDCVSYYKIAAKKRRVLDNKKLFAQKLLEMLERTYASQFVYPNRFSLTCVLLQERSMYIVQHGVFSLYRKRANCMTVLQSKEARDHRYSLVYFQHYDEFFLTTESVGSWITEEDIKNEIQSQSFSQVPQSLAQCAREYGNQNSKIVIGWRVTHLTTQQTVF